MRAVPLILFLCCLCLHPVGGQDASPQQATLPFEELSSKKFPWIPASAIQVVARRYANEWNGDGQTAVTFVCSPDDLATIVTYFSKNEQPSTWVKGILSPRDKLNLDTALKPLGFDSSLMPNGGALEYLALPDHCYPGGPYVIIDRAAKRVWYLAIQT